MKIKNTNPAVVNMKLSVPVDGVIVIDSEGCANVSDRCADIMVHRTRDWQYVDSSANPLAVGDPAPAPQSGENGAETKDERQVMLDGLNAAKVAELKDMCTQAGLPEEEWKNLTKPLLVQYLIEVWDRANGVIHAEEKKEPESPASEEEYED